VWVAVCLHVLLDMLHRTLNGHLRVFIGQMMMGRDVFGMNWLD
jgi:hypothetical protein